MDVIEAPGSGRRFDVKFKTTEQEYAVPDGVFQVAGGCNEEQLNNLINNLLTESNDSHQTVQFDFLVDGYLLRISLEDHLEDIASSKGDLLHAEQVIDIQYFQKQKPPEPADSLLHDDWVSAVHTSTEYILSGCYDGSLHIWKFDGSHVVAILAHTNPVRCVSWMEPTAVKNAGLDNVKMKDFVFISGSHDETIKVWKWNPKNSNQVDCLFVCIGHVRSVDCLDVNQDLIASGSFDKLLKLWSLERDNEDAGGDKKSGGNKNKSTKRLRDDEGQAVKPMKTSQNKVPLMTLSGHTEAITGVVWMSDKTADSAAPELVTCSMDNTLRIWDIEVSSVKQKIVGSKAFLSVAYSPLRNDLLTGSTDRHIRLWDPRSGSVVTNFTSHFSWVSSVALSTTDSNLFVSGSYDENVKYWDVRLPKASLYDLIGHKDKVMCVDWNQPQHVVSGSADSHVKIFKNHYQ